MKWSLFALSVLLSLPLFSQENTTPRHLPVFDGCADRKNKQVCSNKQLQSFLSKIKYPRAAKKAKAEGKVMVSFIVDTSGAATEVFIKVSSGNAFLDNAALDHVSKMPKWIPGHKEGKPAPVQMTVPVLFRL
ncbi:MAG: energy transducer TonB [Chitinophagales bacterium]|nr:energy transducer TonB [Chitinophagales bacterium]